MRAHELEPYRRCGYELIPLVRPVEGNPETGKRPMFPGWRVDGYGQDQLELLFSRGHNLGVRLTPGQVVLDVDPRNFGEEDSLEKLEADVGDLRGVPTVRTGGGGLHCYFRKPPDVPLVDSLHEYPGLEFKSSGRQVVAAGSVHYSGGLYHWDMASPDLEESPEVPERLLNLIRRPPPREVQGCGDLTAEEVAFCLDQLDPVDFAQHDRWFSLMCSAHHASGGEARYEFQNWSARNPTFADLTWQVGRRWDSLSIQRSGAVVTVGTLFKAVLDKGGELPAGRAEGDFEPVDPEEGGELAGQDRLLHWMNGRHAVVNDEGRFRVYSRAPDPLHGGHRWVSSGRRDFEDLYSHRKVQVGGEKLMPLAGWWLNNRKRRQFDSVGFDPEREVPGMLNLWEGWAMEPRRGCWGRLEELLRVVLTDGDHAMAEYVLNWLAYMFQFPWRQAGVSVVFQGRKGTGKGTLGRAVLGLCGKHGLLLSNREHLVGRFNRHLRSVLFLLEDEASWAGDLKAEAVLKSLITEPWAFYEGKGLEAAPGRNRLHIMKTANQEWVVPAGMDGERRYAVARVADRTPSRAFFDSLYRELEEEGGLEALLFDLQRRDLQGWTPQDAIPATRALVDQKLHSLDEVEEWWYGLLLDGVLPGTSADWNGEPALVYQEHLLGALSEACRAMGASRRSLETKLGNLLTRWAPGTRKTRPAGGAALVERDARGRARAYVVPPLRACREVFEAELGAGFSWGDDEGGE